MEVLINSETRYAVTLDPSHTFSQHFKCNLYCHGRIINNERIADYQHQVITALPTVRGGYEVFVRNIVGKTSTYDVESATTIDELKQKISEKDPESKNYDLFFAGKLLEGAKTVADYSINSESVIMIIVKNK